MQMYDQVEYGEENFDWNELPMLIHPQVKVKLDYCSMELCIICNFIFV